MKFALRYLDRNAVVVGTTYYWTGEVWSRRAVDAKLFDSPAEAKQARANLLVLPLGRVFMFAVLNRAQLQGWDDCKEEA